MRNSLRIAMVLVALVLAPALFLPRRRPAQTSGLGDETGEAGGAGEPTPPPVLMH